jgi:2-hydroxychromene-2-carboxylate isomerase
VGLGGIDDLAQLLTTNLHRISHRGAAGYPQALALRHRYRNDAALRGAATEVSMTPNIEFYFDFISPYTYLASQSLSRIAKAHGAEIDYRPFNLVALMPMVGNRPTTLECEAKGAYAMTDLMRWAIRTGTAFAANPHWRTIDFPRLARGALVAVERNSGSVYVEAVFKALWGAAADLSGQDRLVAILGAAGLEAADLLRAADDANHIAQLKQATAAAAGGPAGERDVLDHVGIERALRQMESNSS